jgi:hypothetical protein
MASRTGVLTCHATLGAGAADDVTLSDPRISCVEVILRSGTGPLWVTFATGGVAATVPVAAAAETFAVVGTGNANRLYIELPQKIGPAGIKLGVLSATADTYSVHGCLEEGGE